MQDVKTVILQGPPYLPCLSMEAIEFYDSILRPSFNVFEYGAGGSTIFLAQRVAQVIAVEDSKPFYMAVNRLLDGLQLHAEVILFEDAGLLGGDLLDRYIHAIGQYPDESFDIVISDGTDNSRGDVPLIAKPKVKPGGWLIIDDVGWDPVVRGIAKAGLQDWRCEIRTGSVVSIIPGISIGPTHTQTAFFERRRIS